MRIGRLVLALGVVALLTTPALAQRGRGMGGRGGADLGTLAQNKSVQEELKVSEDQTKKITEALTKLREDLKDDYAKLGGGRRGGGGGNNATQEERAAARKKTGEAEAKAINGILDEKQQKRLQQIRVQQQGLAALQDEETQKTLKLTDEQKDKIKAIGADVQKEIGNLGGGGGGGRGNPETRQKIQGLRKEAMQNAVKVLNEDQQKTYKEMAGEPFDYKPNQGGKPRTDF
jgi:hypothetical protein